MSDAFEEAPPPLPPRPSLPFAEVSDDIPLITLPKRSSLGAGHAYSTDSKGKPSHWYRRLGRKNVSPYFTDFRGQHAPSTKALGTSTTEMQDEAHLPPKPFKRKRNWNHWRRGLTHTGVFITLGAAVVIFVLLPLQFNVSYRSYGGVPTWSCQTIGYLGGNPWTFVGIDIRLGRMSFGQAKAADLAFNWAVGRGLQAVLTLVAYRVFTDALLRAAEITYVPYDLFTSLALYSTKIDALWNLGKGLLSLRGWRVKAIVGWLLFSTAYLAAFPSLMDAMSGYEASQTSVLTLPNGTNLKNPDSSSLENVLYYYTYSKYPYSPQFYDTALNSSYYDFQLAGGTFYLADPAHYTCESEPNVYQWGFSGEWVIIAASVNSFWLFGLWILWLDADSKSQLVRKGRRMGTYRAIVDISEAMREDLGPNLCAYSEKELTDAVRKKAPLKYFVSEEKEDGVSHIGLSSRPSDKVQLSWDQEYGRESR